MTLESMGRGQCGALTDLRLYLEVGTQQLLAERAGDNSLAQVVFDAYTIN